MFSYLFLFNNWNMNPELRKILSDRAKNGLAQNTLKQCCCVFNHIKKCETLTGIPMDLPFDMEKTLTFIGYLIDETIFAGKFVNVIVEENSLLTRGETVTDWDNITDRKPNCYVMNEADSIKFFEILKDELSKLN